MNAQRLEVVILNAIAQATIDDWLSCSIGDLRNRMGEIESGAANATITSIAEAMISLAQEGILLLSKREDGGRRLSFDLQKRLDQGYISNFFGRGSFEAKLTHDGRKRAGETGRNTPTNEESEDHKFARLAIAEARRAYPRMMVDLIPWSER